MTMKRSDYRRNLARSPLGLGLAGLSLAAGAAGWLASGFAAALLAAPACAAALYAVALATGIGPRAAAAEAERAAWSEARGRLESVKSNKDRLASMRVPDAEVASTLSLAAARGAEYLAACHRAKARDPRADAAIEDCVRLADLFLRELDGQATERRHGLADADPFAEAKDRVVAELGERIRVVEYAARELSGGLSPVQAMEIEESL